MIDIKHGTYSGYTNGKCRCEGCKQAASDFHREKRTKGLPEGDKRHGTTNGYFNYGCRCEACTVAMRPEARKGARGRSLKFNYGISEAQWDNLFQSQEGKCAACGDVPPEDAKRRFHVDHDHSTGAVRGILCHGCNVALGHLKEDQERIAKLGVYLAQWKPF